MAIALLLLLVDCYCGPYGSCESLNIEQVLSKTYEFRNSSCIPLPKEFQQSFILPHAKKFQWMQLSYKISGE